MKRIILSLLGMSLIIVYTQDAPSKTLRKSAEQIAAEQSQCVVQISCVEGTGSGFIVDGKFVVTNYHVVSHCNSVEINTTKNGQFGADTVLSYDSVKDIAILPVPGSQSELPSVTLADSDQIKVGEEVVVISNPQGLKNTVSNGLLSGLREGKGYEVLQISAPTSGGSSGGPVFNVQGKVIGIVKSGMKEGENLSFAVPINDVKSLMAKPKPIKLMALSVSSQEEKSDKKSDLRLIAKGTVAALVAISLTILLFLIPLHIKEMNTKQLIALWYTSMVLVMSLIDGLRESWLVIGSWGFSMGAVLISGLLIYSLGSHPQANKRRVWAAIAAGSISLAIISNLGPSTKGLEGVRILFILVAIVSVLAFFSSFKSPAVSRRVVFVTITITSLVGISIALYLGFHR